MNKQTANRIRKLNCFRNARNLIAFNMQPLLRHFRRPNWTDFSTIISAIVTTRFAAALGKVHQIGPARFGLSATCQTVSFSYWWRLNNADDSWVTKIEFGTRVIMDAFRVDNLDNWVSGERETERVCQRENRVSSCLRESIKAKKSLLE